MNQNTGKARRIRRRKLTAVEVEDTDGTEVDLDSVRERITNMTAQLNAAFVNRDSEVTVILLALLSRQHFLFISDPGKGKTSLIRAFATHFKARTFVTTLNAFSTVDDVFGPTDVIAYTRGVRRRIFDGHLPASHIGLVDEPFKGSTAIRNSFLEVMESQTFNGKPVDLWSLGGGTNWPEIERMDRDTEAFHDRFMLRAIVSEVSDEPDANGDSDFERLLDAGERMDVKRYQAQPDALISMDELKTVHEHILEGVTIPRAIKRMITAVRRQLREQKCILSERRCVRLQTILKASAWLDGRNIVSADDFDAAVYACWVQRSDFAKAKAIVNAVDLKQFQAIAAQIDTMRGKIRGEAGRSPDLRRTRALMRETTGVARSVVEQMNDCPLRRRSVEQLTTAVTAMQREAKPVADGLRALIEQTRAMGGNS